MRTFAEDRALIRVGSYSSAAATFAVAAIAVALVRAAVPFAHGWWLVAYLLLVGGVAQLLLGSGTSPAGCGASSAARFWLWNAGTVAVAIADPLGAPAAVLAGSLALLAALALFARGATKRGPYVLLILFLAGSVLVGCFLGRALPWQ